MKIAIPGIKLIASFEGFSGWLYDDPSGNATIAYGHLVHLGHYHRQRGQCALCDAWPLREAGSAPLTSGEGEALLARDVGAYEEAVSDAITVKLGQNQFDALVSLAYNIGAGGFVRSSVRTAVNSSGDVCAALLQYVHGSDGATLPGLVRRRQAECALYKTPDAPKQATEEEDNVKPFLVWDLDRGAWWFVGPWGAAWITTAGDVTSIEAAFGKGTLALHAASIDAIARA